MDIIHAPFREWAYQEIEKDAREIQIVYMSLVNDPHKHRFQSCHHATRTFVLNPWIKWWRALVSNASSIDIDNTNLRATLKLLLSVIKPHNKCIFGSELANLVHLIVARLLAVMERRVRIDPRSHFFWWLKDDENDLVASLRLALSARGNSATLPDMVAYISGAVAIRRVNECQLLRCFVTNPTNPFVALAMEDLAMMIDSEAKSAGILPNAFTLCVAICILAMGWLQENEEVRTQLLNPCILAMAEKTRPAL
jgi:hypothetical protein